MFMEVELCPVVVISFMRYSFCLSYVVSWYLVRWFSWMFSYVNLSPSVVQYQAFPKLEQGSGSRSCLVSIVLAEQMFHCDTGKSCLCFPPTAERNEKPDCRLARSRLTHSQQHYNCSCVSLNLHLTDRSSEPHSQLLLSRWFCQLCKSTRKKLCKKPEMKLALLIPACLSVCVSVWWSDDFSVYAL